MYILVDVMEERGSVSLPEDDEQNGLEEEDEVPVEDEKLGKSDEAGAYF